MEFSEIKKFLTTVVAERIIAIVLISFWSSSILLICSLIRYTIPYTIQRVLPIYLILDSDKYEEHFWG